MLMKNHNWFRFTTGTNYQIKGRAIDDLRGFPSVMFSVTSSYYKRQFVNPGNGSLLKRPEIFCGGWFSAGKTWGGFFPNAGVRVIEPDWSGNEILPPVRTLVEIVL
jgi:hypothetical protein